jgi:hypothetical protein
MAGKMVGFWHSAFHATFGREISPEPLASEEVMAATIGGLVTAHLQSIAASPAVIALISVNEDQVIVAQIIAQVNGTRKTVHFTAANEEELTATSASWARQVIRELSDER